MIHLLLKNNIIFIKCENEGTENIQLFILLNVQNNTDNKILQFLLILKKKKQNPYDNDKKRQ